MKYQVKELTKVPGGYTAYLHYWEGECYCAHKVSPKLFLEQETRPTQTDVVSYWKSL